MPLELNDFQAFLHRLGRINTLFTAPHPLSKVAGQPQIGETTEEGAIFKMMPKDSYIVSVEAFNKYFLRYLVDNRFFSLMYHYLDSHG